MIRQSGVNPAGMAIDPQPVTTPTTEPESRWRGWEVIQSGASAFVRSLPPLYDPINSHRHLPVQDVADSAAGIDPWGVVGQNNNFQQFTALAGRAIAAYSGLPSEINSLLSYLANLAVVGRFASDQLNAFNACGGSIPEPGTHREKTPDETLENTKGKPRKASQNLRHQYDKSAAPTLSASQLPNTPLALGALVGLSAVGAASASASHTDSCDEVGDAEYLGNICRDKDSCSKQYCLIDDIDGSLLPRSIGDKNNPFTGKLNGKDRTIGNLSKCLVKHLSAEGRIENLTLSDARIISEVTAGVVACEMSGNATISNIRVERADVATKGEADAAIGVGSVNGGGTITNMTALNCTVKTVNTLAHAGIGAGKSFHGTVSHTTAVKCLVETEGKNANAGIGVGYQSIGTVTDTTAVNCAVKTNNTHANAGIGAGQSSHSTVNHTTAVNCHVEIGGEIANAGIGVGYQNNKGTVTDTTAVKCTVKTNNTHANAGIGAGQSSHSTVNHTTAVNCNVETGGKVADAGIGVGYLSIGTVTDTTAVNCTVKTDNNHANAGIGAGQSSHSTVDHTTAVNCDVKTGGEIANAGIGVGYQSNKGTVTNTTAVNCTVKTDNNHANAGIGAGHSSHSTVNHTTVMKCHVGTGGESADAGIGVGGLDGKANIADTKVFYSNVTSKYADADIFGGSNPVICNVIVDGVQKSTVGGCQYWQGNDICAIIAPDLAKLKLPIDNYCPDTSITMTTPPTIGPKVQKITISDPDSAIVIACIAILCTGIFVLVGLIAYRFYSQRSSTNAGRNRAEPMPPPASGHPRAEGQLPTPPRGHYQPLSFWPRNKRPLPVPPGHYQPLTFRHGNTATGDSNPPVGNGKEPAPSEIPVYYELIGYESTDNHGEPVADGQPGIATGGSSSVANTEKPTRPGNPVYHVLTEHGTDSDDNHGEPVVDGPPV